MDLESVRKPYGVMAEDLLDGYRVMSYRDDSGDERVA